MKSQVTLHLILKDWRLNTPTILLSLIGGVIALGVLHIGESTPPPDHRQRIHRELFGVREFTLTWARKLSGSPRSQFSLEGSL